jgi:hypothetical protein
MTIKLDDFLFPIWVPDKYLEIKAHTHEDFVAKGVSNLSDSFLMALELLGWLLGLVVEDLFVGSFAFAGST